MYLCVNEADEHTGGSSSFSSPGSGRAVRLEKTPSDCMPPPKTRPGYPVVGGGGCGRGCDVWDVTSAELVVLAVCSAEGAELEAASDGGARIGRRASRLRISRWRSSASSSSLSPSLSNASASAGSTVRPRPATFVCGRGSPLGDRDDAREWKDGGGELGITRLGEKASASSSSRALT